jgi:hypothetical protein
MRSNDLDLRLVRLVQQLDSERQLRIEAQQKARALKLKPLPSAQPEPS